jgi:hypothetical protein
MTSESFAIRVGWPLDEWMSLTMDEAREILALYDLKFSREVDWVERAIYFGYREGWNAAVAAIESGEGATYRSPL